MTTTSKLLSINCQRGYHKQNFLDFIGEQVKERQHDFLLLQEAPASIEDLLQNAGGYYSVPHTSAGGERKELMIIAHERFTLAHAEMVDLGGGPVLPLVTKTFGGALGVFRKSQSDKKVLILCSLHLPSFLQVKTRQRALSIIKQRLQLVAQAFPGALIIGSGDFNAILGWETERHAHILAPEFHFVPNEIPTYTSHRIEPGNIVNKALWLLGRMGIGKEMTLDHVFTNHPDSITSLTILPTVISDHQSLSVTFAV